jgi:hypothetical protein
LEDKVFSELTVGLIRWDGDLEFIANILLRTPDSNPGIIGFWPNVNWSGDLPIEESEYFTIY